MDYRKYTWKGMRERAVLDNGLAAWAFGSSQYVQVAVKGVEAYLEQQERWNASKRKRRR